VGEGVPKDGEKAEFEFIRAAWNENREAREWVRKEAERGNARAQMTLGGLFNRGCGVSHDKAESKKWYQMALKQYCDAATRGNADAQFELAKIYKMGEGVPRDLAKATEWYVKAGEQGHIEAQYMLLVLNHNDHPHAQGQARGKWVAAKIRRKR